jgi:tetratricopeptide (TPR) repeat protein
MKKLQLTFILIALFASTCVFAQPKASKNPTQKELFDKYFVLVDGDTAELTKKLSIAKVMVKMDTTSKYAYYVSAWSNMVMGNYPTAIIWARDYIVSKNPDFAEGHFIYGQILQAAKQEGGLEEIQKCIELNPNLSVPIYYLASSYFELGNYKMSLLYYNKLEKVDPTNKALYYNRAAVKNSLEDKNGAIEDYGKAIEQDPKHIRAIYNRSNLYLNMQEFAKAEVDLNNFIGQYPGYVTSYYYRGYCYYKLDKLTEACIDLKKAEELGSTDATNLMTQICY